MYKIQKKAFPNDSSGITERVWSTASAAGIATAVVASVIFAAAATTANTSLSSVGELSYAKHTECKIPTQSYPVRTTECFNDYTCSCTDTRDDQAS